MQSCLPCIWTHELGLSTQAAALRGSFDMYMLNFYTGVRVIPTHQHAAAACCRWLLAAMPAKACAEMCLDEARLALCVAVRNF